MPTAHLLSRWLISGTVIRRGKPPANLGVAFLLSIVLVLGASLLPGRISAQETVQQVQEIQQQFLKLSQQAARLQVDGDFDGAIALFLQALALAEKHFGENDPLTGLSLNSLGQNYTNKGDYNEAKRVLLGAVRIFESAPPEGRQSLAQSTYDLAMAYDYNGEYSRAQPLYEKSLTLREELFGSDSAQVAQSLNSLGNLYREKADYTQAEPMFLRALTIRRKLYGPDHPLIAVMINNLAGLYQSQGQTAKAADLFKQAIAIAEKRPNPENLDVAIYLNNLGVLYRTEDPKQSRVLLERALGLREKILGTHDPEVANSLNNIALLEWREGNFEQAEQKLLRALSILQQALGPAHPNVSQALTNLAFLYGAKGQVKRAINLLESGSDDRDRNLELAIATGSEEQKRLYMATIAEGTSANISLHLQSAPRSQEAAKLALTTILRRKGRVLDVMSGQLAEMRKDLDPEGQQLLLKLAGLRGQLSNLVFKGPAENDLERHGTSLKSLQNQIQTIERTISERAAATGVNARVVSIENVRGGLPRATALVEIVEYEPVTISMAALPQWQKPHYAAYVLTRAGSLSWVELGVAGRIDIDIARLRASLRSPQSTDYLALGRVVDDEVMRPIRKLLGKTRNVFLSPDGALNLLPFSALIDNRGRFLIQDYTFSYLTCGRDLLRLRDHLPSKEGPVVLADPLFDQNVTAVEVGKKQGVAVDERRSMTGTAKFQPLEGTATEAKQLSTILVGAKVYTGAAATESVLKQLNAPSILHIATHGFFRSLRPDTRSSGSEATRESNSGSGALTENPLLRSGLALAGANQLNDTHGDDGILTALEAASLNLRGTRLVVLSACETGLGEVQNGEGVYGLRRALVLAGAESQIMSLWKVSDDATQELMVSLYGQLAAGNGRASSLRQVQLALLKDEVYHHPYFWAGFILSGAWGPIESTAVSH